MHAHACIHTHGTVATVEAVRLIIYSCVSKQFNHWTYVLWEMHAILFIPPDENFTTQKTGRGHKDTNDTVAQTI